MRTDFEKFVEHGRDNPCVWNSCKIHSLLQTNLKTSICFKIPFNIKFSSSPAPQFLFWYSSTSMTLACPHFGVRLQHFALDLIVRRKGYGFSRALRLCVSLVGSWVIFTSFWRMMFAKFHKLRESSKVFWASCVWFPRRKRLNKLTTRTTP